MEMTDTYGREISYLRLSITDLCNLRCVYCMPAAGVAKRRHGEILSLEELTAITEAAVRCGVRKVRITGGEPLVRNGVAELCRRIGRFEGVRELCMTTNAVLLPKYAAELKAAGVRRLNISLDTLNAEKFRRLSGIGTLRDVEAGIDAAVAAGFEQIKLNTVLIGVNDDEIRPLADFAGRNGFDLRFIELMTMGVCAHWDRSRFVGTDRVLEALPELVPCGAEGVAGLYAPPGYASRVGLISPITSCFCAACNRIRVTADGRLKPCLHSAMEYRLRGLSPERMEQTIREAIATKPRRHALSADSPSPARRDMNEIGG
jgi:cyclic pyranopterin phosphate synthase